MRKQRNTILRAFAVLAAAPVLLTAYAEGPDPRNTAAPGDSHCGQAGCHVGTPNTGPGSVTITFPGGLTYTPGVKQRVGVTVADPAARRWGFQLSARLASNERSAQAGHFNSVDGNTQVICEDGLQLTGTAACRASAPLEFIEHTQIGTRRGQTNSVTFEFEWTPPAAASGNISFFVAANAANNNANADSGDRVYTARATLTPGAAPPAGPRPSISAGGVVNGGSFQPGFAQNTWVTIRGTNLAANTRTWGGNDFVGNRLPTALDGTAVNINGKPAYVYFISPTQLNVLSPVDTATGNVAVEVVRDGVRSDAFTAIKSAFSPAFFIFNNDRYIAATHANGSFLGPTSLFAGLTTPAKPGETIVLYGTGFGPTNPDFPDGQIIPAPGVLRNTPTVRFGSLTAEVLFAGQTATGLYQLNIKVPDNAPDGDAAVVLTVGGANSPAGAFITVQK
jgi:uncharacterized protein (TIGR03437 family)